MVAARAAAFLYELRSFEPGRRRDLFPTTTSRPPPGVIVHRLSPYLEIAPTIVERLAVAPIEKTIFDLIAILGKKRAALALDEALRLRLTTLERFAEFVERIARQGRNGVRKARELIEERDSRHERIRGPSEVDALASLRWRSAARGRSRLRDLVPRQIVSQSRLCLSRRETRRRDRRLLGSLPQNRSGLRQKEGQEVEAIGWTVIRFSWEEVRNNPQMVIDDIRHVLERLRRQTVHV